MLENACASLLTKERECAEMGRRLGVAREGQGQSEVLDLMRLAATARDNDNQRWESLFPPPSPSPSPARPLSLTLPLPHFLTLPLPPSLSRLTSTFS